MNQAIYLIKFSTYPNSIHVAFNDTVSSSKKSNIITLLNGIIENVSIFFFAVVVCDKLLYCRSNKEVI